jgi:hypothetical protein
MCAYLSSTLTVPVPVVSRPEAVLPIWDLLRVVEEAGKGRIRKHPGGGSRETRGCPKNPFKTELLRCMLENLVGETKAEGRNMTFGG